MFDIIGLIAATLTTISFVPQAWLVIRTRQTAGISLTMYAVFTSGIALWLVYGISKGDLPVTLANFVTLILAGLILILKVQAIFRERRNTTVPADILPTDELF